MSRRLSRPPYAARSPGQVWGARRRGPDGDDTSGRVQLLGLLVILAVSALLSLHGLALATSGASSQRTLRSILPALTDLDQALAAHRDSIRDQAAAGEPVTVPGVPLSISVPATAAGDGGATMRQAAVDAMVRAVRDHGAAAFQTDGLPAGTSSLFSRHWTVQRTLELTTQTSHDRLVRLRTYALLPALVFGGLLVWASGLRRAPVSLGSAVAFGAMLAALFALLGRLVAWVVGSGSGGVTADCIGRVARDLSMTGIAVAVTAGAGGVLAAVAGAVVARILRDASLSAEIPAPGRRGARPSQWEEG